MKSRWITALAGVVAAVVLSSVALGLASPDGQVADSSARPTGRVSTEPSPTPTPSPAPTPAEAPDARRAPASVADVWPGRPSSTTVDTKSGKVDWCPAVRLRGAAEAKREFGSDAVNAAACAAVRFVFDQRYSRLAVPRTSYRAADLDFVLPALSPATASGAYRPRVNAFIANPNSPSTRERLGLVLFRGEGTSAGAKHAAAGEGRVFYGKAFTTRGYRDRAIWINPRWSRVTISIDRSKAQPRIVASLDASAAVPVFNISRKRDDMLTVPTKATFFLRGSGRSWKIGGWDIDSGEFDYGRLKVRR